MIQLKWNSLAQVQRNVALKIINKLSDNFELKS